MGINKHGVREILEEYLEDYKTRAKFKVEYIEDKIVIYPNTECIKEIPKEQQVLNF